MARRASWPIAAAGAGVVAAAVAYVVVGRAGGSGEIPPPPDPPRQPIAIREHLRDTYAAARGDAGSVDAVGAYCLALHADMLYEPADRCYERAIALADREWQWTYYRALLRSDLGDADQLVPLLRRVVDAQPGFAPAWLRLGDAEFKAARYDAAERAWTRVMELPEPPRSDVGSVTHIVEVPASHYAALGLARIRLMHGDRAAAQQILERVVTGGPPFGSADRLLAEIHDAAGRADEAARALRRARALPPFAPYADPMVDRLAGVSRNSTFLLRLASEADLALNGAWSEYLTRRALQFDPDNPEVVSKLGRVLRTRGQTEEALAQFMRYREMVPGDLQVLAHIGTSLSELGRVAEAEPYLRQAATALDDALSHYNLALLLAMTGRVDEAIVEYGRAIDRDPNDVNARSNLAAALVRKGDSGGALSELTRVLVLDPENAVARANLGIVYAQRGDRARARRELQEALRLDPTLTQAAEALDALGS